VTSRRRAGRPADTATLIVIPVVALVLSAGLAACSRTPSDAAAPAATTTPTVAWAPTASDRQVPDGFMEVTVHIRQPDGSVRDQCLLLAKDEVQRERGLMFVTDADLGGHGGMLFEFPQDDQGAFWMKNTILPLSIAYLASDGTIVSKSDMDPCPLDTATCPTYPAPAPYRYAVEVPKGRLDAIGLVDGSRLAVGDESCT
jgi:uncharacterized membrane protein (UPF0127 family)